MKKKLIVLFLISAFNSLALFSQSNFSTEEGIIVDRKKDMIYNIIGYENGLTYFIHKTKNICYLEKADLNQQTQAIVTITNDTIEGNILLYHYALTMRDYICIIYYAKDKKRNENIGYVRKFDKNSLKPASGYIELMREPLNDIIHIYSFAHSNMLYDGTSTAYNLTLKDNIYFLSYDKTKLLLIHSLPKYKPQQSTKLIISVFDCNNSRLWHRNYDTLFTGMDFSVLDANINNNGDVFISGKLYEKHRQTVSNRQLDNLKYYYNIISIKENSEVINISKISINNYNFTNLKIGFDREGKPFAIGFYTSEKTNLVSGVFYITFNELNGEILQHNETDFDNTFIQDGMSQQELKASNQMIKEGKDQLSMYEINNIFIDDNNEITLVAEKKFIDDTEIPTPNGQATPAIVYNFHDIMMIHFNSTGNVIWKKKIPKRQWGLLYSSFNAICSDNNIYLFFNDNPENNNLLKGDSPKILTDKAIGLTAITVNCDNGDTIRNTLSTKSKEDIFFCKSVSIFSNDMKSIVYFGTLNERKYQFVKITVINKN